ncbi:MAG: efflux transporter outer membrane subunit [Asticcacaulis sp.]|uniref:efflux transporter outer membrane subunit n=1 Tax=Asticcacaulis sp. TaxID=1872648 RepID=UPI0039E214B2
MPNRNLVTLPVAALLPTLLAACSMAPAYQVPVTPEAPAVYSETGPWTPAAPADDAARGTWWQVFNDATLNDLEGRIEGHNLQLAAALARYDQAVALTGQAQAGLLPSLNLTAWQSRTRDPRNGDLNNYLAGATASYEIDLWGRIRNTVAANRANAEASAADVATLRLSLQAKLAETYMSLRGADAQIALLHQSVEAYQKALDLTTDRFKGGAAGEIDVGRARTQLGTTQSQLEQLGASRALLEHAIAVLLGEQPSSFHLDAVSDAITVPQIPVDAPSGLLQRRPDIAAAERRVYAANAGIGVARAARFPSLTLAAGGGNEEYVGQTGPYWAIGPVAASLPVFDGGARKAGVASARAQFEQAADTYRLTVLTAFQDVEDQLALNNRLAVAADRQDEAVTAATRTNQLALIQYKEGAASYLDVVTAQTSELDARRTALTLRTTRLLAGIDLIRALGGGWQASK